MACGAGETCRGGSCASCSAEVCDNVDNDCDGQVDEGFRNAVTGTYDQATACGNCSTDCTVIYARPNASGVCNAAGTTPVCSMRCDAGSFDLNAVPDDGCEFSLDASAIYVSVADGLDSASCGLGPAQTGGGRFPCRTLAAGLARGVAGGKTKLLVAAGSYLENVTLRPGLNVLGGHNPSTWTREPSTNLTIIRGVDTGADNTAVIADGISSATTFDGFTVLGANASGVGANSYAISARNSPALIVTNNVVIAGSGGRGAQGTAGAQGAPGGDGQPGANCVNAGTTTCTTSSGPGGFGGSGTCGGSGVSGGAGASSGCPGTCNATAQGANGTSASGGGAAGTGGLGGSNWRTTAGCSVTNTCAASNVGNVGGDGQHGAAGGAGVGVSAANAGGTVVGAHWRGASATNGGNGTPGGGGGGGGAGGGLNNLDSCPFSDLLGSAGGGGGAGGCFGVAGGAGSSGGGSFGIFVTFSTPTASLPTIQNNTVTRGHGGEGGSGGPGGTGALGGRGGLPGSVNACTSVAPVGAGGQGGTGGNGGHGGGGGGGAGGVSYGIHLSGSTATPSWNSSNTFVGGASAAPGGFGGASLNNPGSAGAPGPAANTNF